MTVKNLLAAGLALSRACTAALADWVPTGFTTIAQFPDKLGKNARTLVIEAQLAREEVWRQNGKPTRNKRWVSLPNATIQFEMHPSTGVERRGAATAAAPTGRTARTRAPASQPKRATIGLMCSWSTPL